jgi:mRNA-degrading endonuclease toxin of MazEF toxin-antitoxin module
MNRGDVVVVDFPYSVQCENLVTRDQRLVGQKLGELSPGMMLAINDCLRAALGI